MPLDTSAAPELALLALAGPVPGGPGSAGLATTGPGAPVTVGELAARLGDLAAAPERWWGRVRFDPRRPARAAVPAPVGCTAWLLVLPPGWDGPEAAPGWQVACLVAGEMSEWYGGLRERPFVLGRTRVRGTAGRGSAPSRLVNRGAGYAVSLHAAASADAARIDAALP